MPTMSNDSLSSKNCKQSDVVGKSMSSQSLLNASSSGDEASAVKQAILAKSTASTVCNSKKLAPIAQKGKARALLNRFKSPVANIPMKSRSTLSTAHKPGKMDSVVKQLVSASAPASIDTKKASAVNKRMTAKCNRLNPKANKSSTVKQKPVTIKPSPSASSATRPGARLRNSVPSTPIPLKSSNSNPSTVRKSNDTTSVLKMESKSITTNPPATSHSTKAKTKSPNPVRFAPRTHHNSLKPSISVQDFNNRKKSVQKLAMPHSHETVKPSGAVKQATSVTKKALLHSGSDAGLNSSRVLPAHNRLAARIAKGVVNPKAPLKQATSGSRHIRQHSVPPRQLVAAGMTPRNVANGAIPRSRNGQFKQGGPSVKITSSKRPIGNLMTSENVVTAKRECEIISNAETKKNVIMRHEAQQVTLIHPPRASSEMSSAGVKRSAYPTNAVFIRTQAPGNISNPMPSCENGTHNAKTLAQLKQNDLSHRSGKNLTCIQRTLVPRPPQNVQTSSRKQKSAGTPTTAIGRTNIQEASAVSVLEMGIRRDIDPATSARKNNPTAKKNNANASTISLSKQSRQSSEDIDSHRHSVFNKALPRMSDTIPNTANLSSASTTLKSSTSEPVALSPGSSCENSFNRENSGPPCSQNASTGGASVPNKRHLSLLSHSDVPKAVDEFVEVRLPYGSIRSIRLNKVDEGRHIPVWNTKQQYKLAGTSAPLGRNLLSYLQRKKGEYEVYDNQDRRDEMKEKKVSARVTLWNKVELRKISGTSAPLRKNLEKYLKEHPHCEVYDGQANNLDPSLRLREHDRVTLWNTMTCRRTGFGSAGPLRKNLESYLRRRPHLQEYKGQDKDLHAAQKEAEAKMTGVPNIQQPNTADHGGELWIIHDNQRWHPQSPCRKRPCAFSSQGEPSHERLDSQETPSNAPTRSTKRHCPVDLSDVPDFHDFPVPPGCTDPHILHWALRGFVEFCEQKQSGIMPAGVEEDGLKAPANLEEELDTESKEGEEALNEQREEANMEPQFDKILDFHKELEELSNQFSASDENRFDPDIFLNLDQDPDEVFARDST